MSAKGMQATVIATMIHAAREQDGHSALHFGPAMTALIREMAEATVAPTTGCVQHSDELIARTPGEKAAYLEGVEEGKMRAKRDAASSVLYQARSKDEDKWSDVLEGVYDSCRRLHSDTHETRIVYGSNGACDVPPSGWECSRKKGHEGPCAADQTKLEAVTKGLLDGEGSTDDWKTFTSVLTAAGMTIETAEAVLGRTVTQPRQQTPAWEDGVKELAQTLDPECWVSYSGKPKHVKQYMEGRRVAALNQAREQIRGGS